MRRGGKWRCKIRTLRPSPYHSDLAVGLVTAQLSEGHRGRGWVGGWCWWGYAGYSPLRCTAAVSAGKAPLTICSLIANIRLHFLRRWSGTERRRLELWAPLPFYPLPLYCAPTALQGHTQTPPHSHTLLSHRTNQHAALRSTWMRRLLKAAADYTLSHKDIILRDVLLFEALSRWANEEAHFTVDVIMCILSYISCYKRTVIYSSEVWVMLLYYSEENIAFVALERKQEKSSYLSCVVIKEAIIQLPPL